MPLNASHATRPTIAATAPASQIPAPEEVRPREAVEAQALGEVFTRSHAAAPRQYLQGEVDVEGDQDEERERERRVDEEPVVQQVVETALERELARLLADAGEPLERRPPLSGRRFDADGGEVRQRPRRGAAPQVGTHLGEVEVLQHGRARSRLVCRALAGGLLPVAGVRLLRLRLGGETRLLLGRLGDLARDAATTS